jgi:hypothetical protein
VGSPRRAVEDEGPVCLAGASAFGHVLPVYVDDHPPEELVRLSPGRDLGWPYCNPEPDVQPGVPGSAIDPSGVAVVYRLAPRGR